MNAFAAVRAEVAGHGGTRLAGMRSAPPLLLRATPLGVYLVGGAAGPIGGDHLVLSLDVGPGAELTVRSAAASVALPGPSGRASCLRIEATVAAGGRLRWLPEPAVAAARCHHRLEAHLELAAEAALVWRDELVLGRHGEEAGRFASRTVLDVDGRPVLRQEVALGPGRAGWNGPAVVADSRAVGSVVLVDPRWTTTAPPSAVLDQRAALLALPGPAAQVVAGADDAVGLRRLLDQGTAAASPCIALRR